jgi:hypothetical protein
MTDQDGVRDAVRARYAEAAALLMRGDPVEGRLREASCWYRERGGRIGQL